MSTSAAPVAPSPWYRPGSADLVFVAALAMVLPHAQGKLLSDPGLGWHLRNIDAMIAEGGWLTADPFSMAKEGGPGPWRTNQWLGDLALWLGERWAGKEGIAVVAAVVIAFTLRTLYAMLLHDGVPWLAAVGWTCAAALATSCGWVARPNLFTLFFVMWTARQCVLFHEGRLTPRQLAWVPAVFLVWANTHGGFLAGFVILLVTLTIEIGRRMLNRTTGDIKPSNVRIRLLAVVTILSFVATLVNPYGITLYPWTLLLLGNPTFMSLNEEWKSPRFHGEGAWQFEILILLLPVCLALSRRRANPVELGLTVVFLHFALTGVRYLPLWVLVAVPLLARQSVAIPGLGRLANRIVRPGAGGVLARQLPAGGAFGTAVACVVLLLGSKFAEGRFARLLPDIVPTEALDRLVELHAQEPPGAVVFHHYNWGGYLAWRGWPHVRTWIDDRNEAHGEQHTKEHFEILDAAPGWEGRLSRADVRLICVPPGVPLARELEADTAHWRRVYEDRYASIFVLQASAKERKPHSTQP